MKVTFLRNLNMRQVIRQEMGIDIFSKATSLTVLLYLPAYSNELMMMNHSLNVFFKVIIVLES